MGKCKVLSSGRTRGSWRGSVVEVLESIYLYGVVFS